MDASLTQTNGDVLLVKRRRRGVVKENLLVLVVLRLGQRRVEHKQVAAQARVGVGTHRCVCAQGSWSVSRSRTFFSFSFPSLFFF